MKSLRRGYTIPKEERQQMTVEYTYTGVGCSVPKDVISVHFTEGLQKIGDDAFLHCSSLESITLLPSTVVEIGDNAFACCSNLKVVTLNYGLQKIGEGADVPGPFKDTIFQYLGHI